MSYCRRECSGDRVHTYSSVVQVPANAQLSVQATAETPTRCDRHAVTAVSGWRSLALRRLADIVSAREVGAVDQGTASVLGYLRESSLLSTGRP